MLSPTTIAILFTFTPLAPFFCPVVVVDGEGLNDGGDGEKGSRGK
jgi:hypothetical protein